MSEIVTIGTATLYHADCRDVLPTLGKFDLLLTDPPYGVNLGNHRGASDSRANVLQKGGYASYVDTPENFKEIVAPAICAALAISIRGVVFTAGKSIWMLPPADSIGGIYLPSGMGRNSWGFASLQHCLFYGSAPDLHLGAKATARYSTETAEKNGHPCPKPIQWIAWLLDLASRQRESVLDPFMGSGTTGVACIQSGRAFTGIERERKYFDIACERISRAHAQGQLFAPEIVKPEQMVIA